MFFWTTAAQVAARMETMRKAEAGLVALARRFGDKEPSTYNMEIFDTEIPSSVLPFRTQSNNKEAEEQQFLSMHAIRVTQKKDAAEETAKENSNPNLTQSQYPLVIVHGYMNGALYFYRNLVGLTSFFDTVISVDLLGWGLSSRPSFDQLKDDSVETAEAFFVESLESWRSKNSIEKMNLAGHSMGGYLSVAYCEKYPERVDRLILLSPVGVPEQNPEEREQQRARLLISYSRKLLYIMFLKFWENGYTPGSIMRMLPESRGRYLAEGYVERRLPAIQNPEEQTVLSEYMYTGSILPGSGEYGLSRILEPGAIAKKPCIHRIPKLKVKHVSFLYGVHDWMDVRGGLDVQSICQEQRQQGNTAVPEIDVYKIKDAGHLLMLENSKGFNAAVIMAGGGKEDTIQDKSHLPITMSPTACAEDFASDSKEPPEIPSNSGIQVAT